MTDDSLLGHQLGNFRLERVLGRGGMGQVYYGWDVKLERPVAVKVINFRFRGNPAYAKRFVREAQAVATWRHENIAQVYYADEQGDLYYFAMEYIDGLDLGQILFQYTAKDELLPQADVLRIGQALASALDYAHARDVVHRDVKPSNVIVARDDRVVLTDFGLALEMHQGSMGEVFGTAHYISPEQARRSSGAIPQSDLYSLGIILYEMLTGVVPFDDPSPTAVAVQHITQPPPAPRSLNPSLNIETEAVLLKALSKLPHDRYQTGRELITALEIALQTSSAPPRPTPLPPPPAGMHLQPQHAPSQVLPVASKTTPRPKKSSSHEIRSTPRQTPQPRRQSARWIILGGCVLVLFVAALASLWLARPFRNLFQVAPPPADTMTIPALLSPEASSDVQATETPLSLVDTPMPSEVGIVDQFTLTPSPATPTVDALNSAPPTVKYPDGKRVIIFYDNNSLYFLNLSDSNIPINWIAFERLGEADIPLNRFNGSRWGEYYSTSKPSWCMALEILDSPPYLDPPECGHDDLYLSLRTPTRNDATVFWTAKEGSHQFRVLWREGGQDEEVARCETDAGVCEVFLP